MPDDPVHAALGRIARWKLAFAHHPYISNGEHGDAGTYDGTPLQGEDVKLFLEQGACDKVDVYFAGHDHDLEWLKPVEACGKTQFIVSGAGAKTRIIGGQNHATYFSRGATLGFWWVEIAGDTLHAVCYSSTGAQLFEQSVQHA